MTTSRGVGLGQPSDPPKERKTRAKWTTSLTKILVDLMVEQVQKGGKENNTIGRKEWSFLCDEFHRKTGMAWDKELLKNQCAILKKHYAIVKSILDRDDFVFDESTGIIEAEEEAWAQYIRENPDAEFIRTYGCPMFKELCIIFGGREISPPSTHTSSNFGKRGMMSVEDSIAVDIWEMTAALRRWIEAVRQRNANYSIANCIRELDTIPGLPDKLYLTAMELFYEPSARETFLSLRKDLRYIWLCRKYLAASPRRNIHRV